MAGRLLRIVVVLVVVLTSWAVGHVQGQNQVADFSITVVSPSGKSRVMCNKGCVGNWLVDVTCPGSGEVSCASDYNQTGPRDSYP
jgi:hypothetical protein